MIRLHLVMLLALAQCVFAERLVIKMATGGRGVVMVTNLLDPWVTLLLVIAPFWTDIKKALWTKPFVVFWMPFLVLSFVLPFLGVLFAGYPVRTIIASWNAIIPFSFLAIGSVGVFHYEGAGRTVLRYFLFAIFMHLGLAMVQTMGQFEYLPGPLKSIYEWDFQFKVAYQPENLILGRATGFYLNPNSLGIWAVLALWTSFFLLSGKERVAGVVGSFITILLCQSRGTMAAFLGSAAIYTIVWMIQHANREERLKATLFMVACVIPMLIIATPGLMDSILGRLKDVPVVGRAIERYISGAKVLSEGAAADANFQGRTHFWQAAVEYLAEHPFGSLGSPEMMIKVPPDNQFVAALEQGSFYFLAALLLVFHGGVRLINSSHAHSRLVAVASLALIINGITAVPFAYSASAIYWLLLGVYLAKRIEGEVHGPLKEEPS